MGGSRARLRRRCQSAALYVHSHEPPDIKGWARAWQQRPVQAQQFRPVVARGTLHAHMPSDAHGGVQIDELPPLANAHDVPRLRKHQRTTGKPIRVCNGESGSGADTQYSEGICL